MKKNFLLLTVFLLGSWAGYAQKERSITINKVGTLESIIPFEESNEITHLTITGTINAVDFNALKLGFKNLEVLDLSDVYIRNYLGKNGTAGDKILLYPNNGIPAYAFSTFTDYSATGKNSLHRIVLPKKLKSIGKAAFANCQNLSVVVLPSETVPTLGDNALSPQRTAIFITPGKQESYLYDKSWGPFALIDTEPTTVSIELDEHTDLTQALLKINIQPNKVNFLTICGDVSLDDMLLIRNYMPNLVKIDLSNTTLKEIPEFTFAQKVSLLEVELPNKLITIGDRAFDSCIKLGPIISLPTSVKTISEGAFNNCPRLDGVVVKSKLKAVADNVFGANNDNKFIFKE